MFINKVTTELIAMCAEGYPVYVVANMHDGVIILHKKDMDLQYLSDRVNEELRQYSKASIGLALHAVVKDEAV